MNELRKTSIYESSQDSLLLDINKKKKRCGIGVIKCFGLIFFWSLTNALSFYMGIKYRNHLEDSSESI